MRGLIIVIVATQLAGCAALLPRLGTPSCQDVVSKEDGPIRVCRDGDYIEVIRLGRQETDTPPPVAMAQRQAVGRSE